MNNQIKEIENTFKSIYSQDNYISLIREVFDGVKIQSTISFKKEYSNFSSHIEGYSYIGMYESPDNKKIAVFSVRLKTNTYVENSRSTQRSFVRKMIDAGNCDAAIVAFYAEGESRWRLSFVRLDYEMKFENGKFKSEEVLTPAKRYSFLLGKDEPCHTAIDRFRLFIEENSYKPTLNEIEEAFSVEKVTKEFFELYREKFYQLQEYLDSNEDFVAEAQRCGFTSEQFAKKLMGQIVFLYFLQKKGWLGVNVWAPKLTEKEFNNVFFTYGAQGRIIKEHLPKIYIKQDDGSYRLNSKSLDLLTDDEETLIANHMPRKKTWGSGSHRFLRTIYDWSQKNKGHFFNDYLEPLFYDALNRNRHNIYDYCVALHCRVPFLSGGLFEPLDGYEWKATNFNIPDEMFSNIIEGDERNANGILDIFDRYNFTISEDEPMEREVAIDPEMLGKVFENLLEVKDRKSKGAFYTPREIVHYMCQESLINYLVRKTGLDENDIRDFILYGDFMKDEDTTKEKREGNGGMFISEKIFKIDSTGTIVVNRLKDIDDALATVRVADPAVGSGAFPLGMVNEIVKARQNITAYLTIGMNAADKRYIYINERSTYLLKYNAIRNSIYAVDIEPSAVDIAQLRLWLSLVIDDEINPDAQTELDGHKNPLPLPNLECNILCGNSLIDEFKGAKLVPSSDVIGTDNGTGMLSLTDYTSKAYLDKYLEAQKELFNCDDTNKKHELLDTIELCKAELIRKQLEGQTSEDIQEFNKVYQLPSKPFVLWQLDFARVFRENGGFDIVIGNPPYISSKGVEANMKKTYERVFGFSDDTYNMFSFKGIGLLCNEGNMNYIIPKTFWTTQTKRNMRDMLLSHNIRYIFDTANPFESAMVDTCIIQVVNARYSEKNTIKFLDGSINLSNPIIYSVEQEVYLKTQNSVIFTPTTMNLKIHKKLGEDVKRLYDIWWDKIKTSKDIEKNKSELEEYRSKLEPGDIALLGCLTEGGQGLATANNGKYIAIRKSSKWAANVIKSRPKKLQDVVKSRNIPNSFFSPYNGPDDFLLNADEHLIAQVFDDLKEKYGRDIFGQGYIYRLIEDDEIACVDELTDEEKSNGISTDKKYYVPYDKGDKDGNRWYLETPFAIAWSKENVHFLKTNSGKKGSGMPVVRNPQFNFREGFCWSDINTTYLKCRLKGKSVNDVKSMSLYGLLDKVPEYYIVSLINSSFISFYVDCFVNNTQTFQINDARQLPIIIPNKCQLQAVKELFDTAVEIKRAVFSNKIDENTAQDELNKIQKQLDNLVLKIYSV